jgi:hypothetical protein
MQDAWSTSDQSQNHFDAIAFVERNVEQAQTSSPNGDRLISKGFVSAVEGVFLNPTSL